MEPDKKAYSVRESMVDTPEHPHYTIPKHLDEIEAKLDEILRKLPYRPSGETGVF